MRLGSALIKENVNTGNTLFGTTECLHPLIAFYYQKYGLVSFNKGTVSVLFVS